MQVNDNGTASYFAVLKKSAADQKARIEKSAEKKKAEKKVAEKKAEKKRESERLEKKKTDKLGDVDSDEEETITITANSVEELMKKISDYNFAEKSDNVQTDTEKLVGQHVDFRG